MRRRNLKATSKTCVWKTSRKDFHENDEGIEMTGFKLRVSWELYPCDDLHYKCPSFPYDCDKCSKGRYRNGEIRLHITIAGKTLTIIATLGHEFIHFILDKLHTPRLLHKILDEIGILLKEGREPNEEI
jgi:hypothetical protein